MLLGGAHIWLRLTRDRCVAEPEPVFQECERSFSFSWSKNCIKNVALDRFWPKTLEKKDVSQACLMLAHILRHYARLKSLKGVEHMCAARDPPRQDAMVEGASP